MARSSSSHLLCAGIAFAFVLGLGARAAAQPGYVPNFHTGPGGWTHPFGGSFPSVQGSALPVQQDPGHHYVNTVESFHIPDLANPNVKQWAKDIMRKDTEEIDAGKMQWSANSSCVPAGTPMFVLSGGPFFILQAPTKVVMLDEGSQHARRIYLNVPHSQNVEPSWFGESVGWYEGETLVVDTIGISTKSFVDSYRTPHTEKLHVVERWRLIDGGNMLQVDITVDDPETYYQPWRTYQRYQRGNAAFNEEICAENNFVHLFDYGTPVAEKPDF